MNYSLEKMAYSVPMSYQAIRYLNHPAFTGELNGRPEGLYLRMIHGMGRRACFRIVPLLDGEPCEYSLQDITMTAAGVVIRVEGKELALTFASPEILCAGSNGLGVRFDMTSSAYEYVAVQNDKRALVNTSASWTQYMFSAITGTMQVDAPYDTQCCSYIHCDFLPDTTGRMNMVTEQFEKIWQERTYTYVIEECMVINQAAFDAFAVGFPPCEKQYENARQEAIFILWSGVVKPYRYVTRRGIYCSNNWMTGVWTWDSAIISMGTSLGDFDLALDQLLFPFDSQTPEGLLPDYVNPNEQMWNFTKPPVHGIALQNFFIDRLTPTQLQDIREKFAMQIAYYERYTDSDHDGIYQYNHGNDCGWDNCTPFEVGAPVEGPDLNAYLILEMHALAAVCKKLGDQNDAEHWTAKAEHLQQKLLSHSWDGEHFRVYQSGTHKQSRRGDSLYNYLPVCLGHHLPKEIFEKLVNDLKEPGRFLTAHGFATESVKSDCYEPDGYWRGPIWAPIMLLMIQGIVDGGDRAFGMELARRFCDTCAENGFAENYNAVTGKPLRDQAFAWTASAFIVLYSRYLQNANEEG